MSELVPIVRDLLAPAGSASADVRTGTLVMRGEPAALAEARAVLAELDVALAEYRVQALVVTRAELAGLEIELGGRAGPVVIGPDVPAYLSLAGRFSHGESTTRSELRVQEGRWGSIWTGSEVPVDVHVVRGRRHREVWTGLARQTRSGLRVRTRAAGDGSVGLDVEAIVEQPQGRGVDVVGGRVHVRLQPGQLVAVAGVDQAEASTRDPLLGTTSRAANGGSAVLLRVDPVRLDGP